MAEVQQAKRKISGIINDDRPLPHDPDAEAAVLGAILTEPRPCLDDAIELLGSASNFYDPKKDFQKQGHRLAVFYNPRHQRIYSCACEMHDADIAIDLISLSHALNQKKILEDIGGEVYLLELMNCIATVANLETWCVMVRDFAILRNLIVTCESIKDQCYEPDSGVSSILDEVEKKILDVGALEERADTYELKTLIDFKNENGAFKYLINLSKQDESTAGIPTLFPELDKLITGLKPGEMFVLAARPSIGKTSLALNMITNVAVNKDRPVGFFSLEMTAEQIARRLLCTESGYSEKDFYDGNVTNINKVTAAADRLCKAHIFIDPTPALRIRELRSKARRMKSLHNVQAIFIDYLQLMKAEIRSDSRQEEVSAISSGIKALAKELHIPIVVLAQLNREVEKTQGKPKLSHLRESGAIEQDADIVAFLHRERDTQKDSSLEAQSRGIEAELIIEKNRNGQTGVVQMLFFPNITLFRCRSRIPDEDVPR